MGKEVLGDREKMISIISIVLSEETGIPKEEIGADTKIPNSEAGFKTIMRMANSIPLGGGLLHVQAPQMCTVGELADQCIEEVNKKLEKFKKERRKS